MYLNNSNKLYNKQMFNNVPFAKFMSKKSNANKIG